METGWMMMINFRQKSLVHICISLKPGNMILYGDDSNSQRDRETKAVVWNMSCIFIDTLFSLLFTATTRENAPPSSRIVVVWEKESERLKTDNNQSA
jgi:hypothetical protein